MSQRSAKVRLTPQETDDDQIDNLLFSCCDLEKRLIDWSHPWCVDARHLKGQSVPVPVQTLCILTRLWHMLGFQICYFC